MSHPETEIPPNAFPTTRWTVVMEAAQTGDTLGKERAAEALDSLCGEYRGPILAFIRGQGYSQSDADDIVQEFLAKFVHNGGFGRADASKGKLRTYLLRGARHFLTDRHRKQSAEKRGGGAAELALDDLPELANGEGEGDGEGNASAAQHAYDKKWARLVMDRALEAVRDNYRRRGRESLCDDLFAVTEGRADDLAARETIRLRHGLSGNAFRTQLHRFRDRLGDALRETVAHTVSGEEQVEEELRYLGRLWMG